MARKRLRFPEHPAITSRRNIAYVELMAGRPLPELRADLPAMPKPRATPQDGGEGPVVAAVGELLAAHPKVLFAVRQNSGMASYEAKSGRYAPVYFYKVVTGQPVRISDYWGIMRDGRMLALECKRPSWRKPTDQREREQWAFLELVRNSGGVAGFVRSVDEVQALLA